MKDINFIQILWEYMKMNHELKHSDCIIGLGSMDINVANVTSELYLKGYANKIIFSGGLGKITYKLWNETEAEKICRNCYKKRSPKRKYIFRKRVNKYRR